MLEINILEFLRKSNVLILKSYAKHNEWTLGNNF